MLVFRRKLYILLVLVCVISLSAIGCKTNPSSEKNITESTMNQGSTATQTASEEETKPSKIEIKEEDSKKSFELTKEEKYIYQSFVNTKDDNLLRDLKPIAIYKLFAHSIEEKDYRTEYALFNLEAESYGEKPSSVDEFIQKINDYNVGFEEGGKLISQYFNNLTINYDGDKAAYLEWSYTVEEGEEWEIGASLIKDKNGIWKMRWQPYAT